MVALWVLTAIFQYFNFTPAVELWHWFGAHAILTIILMIILA